MIPPRSDWQGPDIGDQYRSEIFYKNETQKTLALKYIEVLKGKGLKVATGGYPCDGILSCRGVSPGLLFPQRESALLSCVC
ncbi:MAG: peptide-methionine (S)-S-oxide reductase [Marinilabiliales bacterium]|nr:peptide-methionine (S)-S-oxide reductase [Marinilabiliales bacterium]